MTMRIPTLLVVLSLFGLQAVAQTATITGRVVDDQGEPLFSVNVSTDRLEGTTTDFDGFYTLNVEPGETTVSFSFIGFEKAERAITLAAGEERTLDMTLQPAATELGTIVIGSSKRGKPIAEETVTVDVISTELLQNNNIVEAADAIDRVPGVTVVDGQASIRGGTGYAYGVGSRVILVVDDIPLLTPERNEVLWDFVPMEVVDQIEVVKGASSVQYGSSALNGVVHARTKWASTANPKQTNVTAFFGLYDRPEFPEAQWWGEPGSTNGFLDDPHRMGIHANHVRRINDQHDIVIGGFLNSHQTHLEQEFNHQVRGIFKWRYRPKNVDGLTLTTTATTMYRNRAIFFLWDGFDEGMFRPLGGGASYRARYQYLTIDPTVSYYFGKEKRHSIRSINRFYIDRNLRNLKRRDGNNGSNFIYNDIQYGYSLGDRFSLLAGVSNRTYSVRANALSRNLNDENAFRLSESAAYLQAEAQFAGLTLSGGARFEAMAVDQNIRSILQDTVLLRGESYDLDGAFLFSKPIFRFGANYNFRTNNYVRASVGQSFRVPSLAERFVDESLAEDFRIFANPQILPEEGFTLELGYKRTIDIGENFSGYVDAATFYQQFKPLVEFVPGIHERYGIDEDGDGNWDTGLGFRAENVNRARIFGYEFTVSGDGQFGKVPFSILAGYTYSYAVDARKDDDLNSFGNIFTNSFQAFRITEEDYELYDNPATRSQSIVNSMLSYRFRHLVKLDIETGYDRFSIGTSMRYYSFMDRVDDVFLVFVDGFAEYREQQDYRGEFVWDVRTGYQVSDVFKISVIARNILNQLYVIRPGKPNAPRSFTVQGNWSF